MAHTILTIVGISAFVGAIVAIMTRRTICEIKGIDADKNIFKYYGISFAMDFTMIAIIITVIGILTKSF